MQTPSSTRSAPRASLPGWASRYKVVNVLGARRGNPGLWRTYTDLATLGTVSDMMLLTGENRSLVAEGVQRLRTMPRLGLSALAVQARRDLTQITADDLAFSVIPRLNAAGRMDDPAIALDLLMASGADEAEGLAVRLERIEPRAPLDRIPARRRRRGHGRG